MFDGFEGEGVSGLQHFRDVFKGGEQCESLLA